MAQLRRRLPPVNSLVVSGGGRAPPQLHPRRRGAGADPVGGQPADPAAGAASGSTHVPAAGPPSAADPRRRSTAPRGDHGPAPYRRHRGRHPPASRHRRAHRGHQRHLRLLLADGAPGPVPLAVSRDRAAAGGLDQAARPSGRRRRHRHSLRQRRMGRPGGDADLRQRDLAGLRACLPERARATAARRDPARRDAPASEPVRPQLGHLAGLAGRAGGEGRTQKARP